MTILAEILATKRAEVAARKASTKPSVAGAPPPRGFKAALDDRARRGHALIAEIKKASPSKGLIRADFDPAAHASAYQEGGAACLSVLTDTRYFQGTDSYLVEARAACDLPVLRKDFIVDQWQVRESRALGADAILLIVAALDDSELRNFEDVAHGLGMDVLIEVHDAAELDRALKLRSRLIGINNRDLRDFSVDLTRTLDLAAHAPDGCTLVTESGLTSKADLDHMASHGIHCFLVGESLMRRPDLAAATRALIG